MLSQKTVSSYKVVVETSPVLIAPFFLGNRVLSDKSIQIGTKPRIFWNSRTICSIYQRHLSRKMQRWDHFLLFADVFQIPPSPSAICCACCNPLLFRLLGRWISSDLKSRRKTTVLNIRLNYFEQMSPEFDLTLNLNFRIARGNRSKHARRGKISFKMLFT